MGGEIRVAVGSFSAPTDERLRYARQIGASGVTINTPSLPGEQTWDVPGLIALRERVESFGLRLEGIENTPLSWYDRAILGLPGRDQQIERYQQTIRNLGRAGISLLGYHWMPNGVWRTSRETLGRGGAQCTSFNLDSAQDSPLIYRFDNDAITQANMDSVESPAQTHGREWTDDELWENFRYFIQAVAPVATEAGVNLAMHPDDPPVPSLGGIPRIMRDPDLIQAAINMEPAASNGLIFCVGTWAEMGIDVAHAARRFADQGRIFCCHFRNVQGVVPRFREAFMDEGDVDFPQVIDALWQAGFTGFVIDDHNPWMLDDTDWGHRARALSTGYIAGLLRGMAHANR